MNDQGQVGDLTFEDIPNFMKEYLRDYAKPLVIKAPELAEAFQLVTVVSDLEELLNNEALDVKKGMPLLLVLWTNLIARMARVETITTAQENFDILAQGDYPDEEDKEKEI